MRDLLYYARLGLESAVGVVGVRFYEEPRHELVERLPGGVEIRTYDARLAAETTVRRGDRKEGADEAFRLLFRYISGANEDDGGSAKIAMTTPVEVRRSRSEEDESPAPAVPVETLEAARFTRMRFFLPSSATLATAPRPADPRVHLVEVPRETLAVLRFSGSPDDADLARRRTELLTALDGSRWRAVREPVTLFYDAPFTIPFLRRNEAAVAVALR